MGYGVNDKVRQKFTGYQRDDETGLDFAQARYYGSAMGRFTSADPFDKSADKLLPQTWNRYTYCVNNPLLFTDPSGLSYVRNNNTGEIFYRKDITTNDDLEKNGLDTSIYEILNGEVFIDKANAKSLGLPGLEGHYGP